MITLVEALRYRCLRYVRQPLGRVAVLTGPNGSGKATFLDVPELLGRIVAAGPETALQERTRDFRDLLWMRAGASFEVAVEASIPGHLRQFPEFDTVRYELAAGAEGILAERLLLKAAGAELQDLFEPDSILAAKGPRSRTVVHKGSSDYFYEESGKGWVHNFRLGPRRAALGHLPDEPAKFPVATWFRDALAGGIRRPPKRITGLVARTRYAEWMACIGAALPDIACVDETRVRYESGLETSLVSEGTRRFLALTAAAFIPEYAAVLLVEKPETALHPPLAVAAFEALRRAGQMQLLITTHSPEILARVPDPIRLPFRQVLEQE